MATITAIPTPPPEPQDSFRSPRTVKTTISTSSEYQQHLAVLTGRAFSALPLTICFARENYRIPHISPLDVQRAHMTRIVSKIKTGAEIIEAGNWAAAACWEPPSCTAQGHAHLTPDQLARRPIFADFLQKIVEAKAKHLGDGQPYWHLSMMARDPDPAKARIPGTVRAVIAPYIARARVENTPIWLEAASERARDVYAYQGFKVMEVIWSGVGEIGDDGYPEVGGRGLATWCMMFDPRGEK